MLYKPLSAVEPDPLVTSGCQHSCVPLEDLARRIREAYRAMQEAESNALGRKLDFGDLLNEAQARIAPANWKRWLRENLPFGLRVSTAQLYQQLARHRDEIEAEIDRVGELSLRRGARPGDVGGGGSAKTQRRPG